MKKGNQKTPIGIVFIILAGVIFGAVYGGITLTKNLGKSKTVVNTENAMSTLEKLNKNINTYEVEARKEPVTLEKTSLEDTLPDIEKYPLAIKPTTQLYIEIFASPEKAGEGKDGWLNAVAKDFNEAGIEVNGQKASVAVRSMASGMGMDYILSGKYTPDVYTPSNDLWGKMLEAQGVKLRTTTEKTVGNVAGVLFSKAKYDELINKYGAINLKSITEAVAGNEIAMGYTNPFASSTGLNFLLATLNTFDSKELLSEKAIAGFESFQENIPFVAYTTLQMRESAESGALDGFIMEYQTYINAADLKSNYVFTPFGIRHDSPMYEVGNLSTEKQQILDEFIAFMQKDQYTKLATDDGFNALADYVPEMEEPDGTTIIAAQKLWKEKKNGSKNITAVFVADISGSMQGAPLNELQKSLINGAQYIGQENSIGLVTYSDDVYINLPIGKFDLNHRSLFTGAVMDMGATGGTATFDGILVATKMLMEAKVQNPDTKLMLFVLSDGETNTGHTLDDVEGILKSLKIPVYTIGYNADIKALQSISNINEAASINADSEDVVYQLGSLFNAQM